MPDHDRDDSSPDQAHPSLRLLSAGQVRRLHNASLDILERTGVRVRLPAAVEILRRAGARVAGVDRVRFPAALVDAALRSAPSRIAVYDRKGRPALRLEGHVSHFGTGPTIQYIHDGTTGERRPSGRDDICRAARLCDALPNIDFVMTMGMTGGVDPAARGLHPELTDRLDFQAMLTHTVKPLVFSSWTLDGLRDIHAMAAAVRGGEEALRARPLAIAFTQPNTPLVHNPEPLEFLLYCARHELPVIYSSAPLMGGTAPQRMAAMLALANAEFLSGLVIHQLARPGAPIVFGAGFGPMDMRCGTSPYNGPECYLSKIAARELADFYGLPDWNYGGLTDSKRLDLQAGIEAGLSLWHMTQVGSNLIHDIGYMETGMAACWELIVLADELIGALRRYLDGIQINDEALALELIDRIGPGGHYLTDEHTFANYGRIWYPQLINRQDHADWLRAGGRPLGAVLGERVRHLLATHTPEPLPADVAAAVEEIVAHAGRRCR